MRRPRATFGSDVWLSVFAESYEEMCGALFRVAAVRSVLLYGAAGSGKTMLVQAIAHESGACFFNLSPRHTDGKYLAKTACTLMVHMVCPTRASAPYCRSIQLFIL